MAAWSTVTVVLLACVCGAFAQSFCCIYGSQVVNSHAAPEYQFASCLSNQCPAHYSFQLYGFYMVGNCSHCPVLNISGSDVAYGSSSTGAVVSSGSYYGSTFTAVATLPLFTGTGSSTTATSSASGSTNSVSMSSTNGGNSASTSSSPSMSSSSNTSPSTKSNDAVDADQDAFERDGGKRNLLSLPEATSGSWNCQYDAITSTAALPVATQPLHGCPPWHLGTCYNMTYPNQMSCTFLGFTIPAPAPPPPATSTTSTTGTGTTSTGTTGSGTTTNPVTTATSATTTQATTATSATTTPGTSTTGAATTGAATTGATTTSTTGTTTAASASSSVGPTTSSPNNTESTEAALADSSEEILEFNPNGRVFCCDYQYVSSTGSLKAFYHLPNETGCPTTLLDELDCSGGQCYLISFWLVANETECTSPGTNVCSEFDGECGSCGYVPGCSFCLDDGTCQASATASCSAAGLITDPSAATCANALCANSILGVTGSYEEIAYNCTTTPVAYSYDYETCSICSTPNGMGGYSLTCFAATLGTCTGAIDNGVASNLCSMYVNDCGNCNSTAGCSYCPNANSNTGNCNMCSVTKAATSGALTCEFEACAVSQTCQALPASCMTYQTCSSCSGASSCKWCNNQCFDSSDMTCNASKCPSGSDIVDILIVVGILVVCGGICLGCYAYRRRSRTSYQPVGNVNYEGGYNNNFNNNQYAPNNYGAANNAFGNAPRSGGYALGAPPQGAPGATYPPLQPQGPAYQRGGPQFQSGVAAPRQAGNFYGDT